LVGSSSSSTFGRASRTPASSARAASPPDSRPSGAPRGVELRLQRPPVEGAEALLRLAVAGQRGGIVELMLEALELAVQPPHLAEGGPEQAIDGELRSRRLLRQVADACTRGARDRAALGRERAGQQAQQRALAGAVRADQRRAVARAKGQRQAVEER
jgi:hypothetical protein